MDAESMAKTVETCCRCGSPLLRHEPVLILSPQSGPLLSCGTPSSISARRAPTR